MKTIHVIANIDADDFVTICGRDFRDTAIDDQNIVITHASDADIYETPDTGKCLKCFGLDSSGAWRCVSCGKHYVDHMGRIVPAENADGRKAWGAA